MSILQVSARVDPAAGECVKTALNLQKSYGIMKSLTVSTRVPDAGHRHSQWNEVACLVKTSFTHPLQSLQESAGIRVENKTKPNQTKTKQNKKHNWRS